jgi:hypothetical protein
MNASPARAVLWLRLEGLTALTLSVLLYTYHGQGWLLFGILLLAPDLSMLGYMRGPRIGAVVYNLFHSYTAPLLLAASAHLGGWPSALAVALIWVAHIGLDRMLGYGLKLPTSFRDTHLGQIGGRPLTPRTNTSP